MCEVLDRTDGDRCWCRVRSAWWQRGGDAVVPYANLDLVTFLDLPATAAWRHLDAREGFEVVYFRADDRAIALEGVTAAIEAGRTWLVDYTIEIDRSWRTRRATVRCRSASGSRSTVLEVVDGAWLVDGMPAPHLDGCIDVDLESSAMTNALPVHRLGLGAGERAESPAAYVRAVDLSVERLDQTYTRQVGAAADTHYYDYTAPAFGVSVRLQYDRYGLVVDYPGIARRAG